MFVWEKDPNYWNKDKLDVKPRVRRLPAPSQLADQAALAFERAEFGRRLDRRSSTPMQLLQHRLPGAADRDAVPRPEPAGDVAELRRPGVSPSRTMRLGDLLLPGPGEDRQDDLAGRGAAGASTRGPTTRHQQTSGRTTSWRTSTSSSYNPRKAAACWTSCGATRRTGRQAHLPGQAIAAEIAPARSATRST